MSTTGTTVGVKLSADLRDRLRRAAEATGQTQHRVIRQLIEGFIQRSEAGESVDAWLNLSGVAARPSQPFVHFARSIMPQTALRAAITSAWHRPDGEIMRDPLRLSHQAVIGKTVGDALANAERLEKQGFRYSFELLAESALSEQDAQRYMAACQQAIHSIGRAAQGRGIYVGPAMCIKLSALHPRYSRAQFPRVLAELYPRLLALSLLARQYDIGLSIDAEQDEHLELSLELLERLCFEAPLAGWNGIGLTIRACQKRGRVVIDYLIDLARRSQHCLMIRLVKNAYRDCDTDSTYIACARWLLAGPQAIYPQFATDNTHRLAEIYELAGQGQNMARCEFQCLHGMHDIYAARLEAITCRIRARVGNPDDQVRHGWQGSASAWAGIDLCNEHRLASLAAALLNSAGEPWQAAPMLGCVVETSIKRSLLNPADRRDVVGQVQDATPLDVEHALQCALGAAPIWQSTPAPVRSMLLARAAERMQAQVQPLMGLLIREAGKTFACSLAEVREAVRVLGYYAGQAATQLSNGTHRPLGPVVCISDWHSPLASFVGQVAAALAAGNPVLAKPAVQAPLIAAQAVRILLQAGVAPEVLQLLPGDGVRVGLRLIGDPRIAGVMFTGSLAVARTVQRLLAGRLDRQGRPLTLMTQTCTLNVTIMDATACPVQAVDVLLASAFERAGQRCSVLCIDEAMAESFIQRLKDALGQRQVGNPERLEVDIGPQIDTAAAERIERHIEVLRGHGHMIYQGERMHAECRLGSFVAPTLIELDSCTSLDSELFGPVLQVIRFGCEDLPALLARFNACSQGWMLNLFTHRDETLATIFSDARARYLNVNSTHSDTVMAGPLDLFRLLSTCPLPLAGPALSAPGELRSHALLPHERVLCLAGQHDERLIQLDAVLAVGARALWVESEPGARSLFERLPAEMQARIDFTSDWTAAEVAFGAVIHHGDADRLRQVCEGLALRPGPIIDVQALAHGAREINLERLAVERFSNIDNRQKHTEEWS